EQLPGAAGAVGRLALAEHRLTEEVDVQPEAVLPGGVQVPPQVRVAGVDEQVSDHLLHPGPGGGDDDRGSDAGGEGPEAEQAPVETAEEGRGRARGDRAQ